MTQVRGCEFDQLARLYTARQQQHVLRSFLPLSPPSANITLPPHDRRPTLVTITTRRHLFKRLAR